MAHSNKQKPGKDFATVNHLQALDICILLIAITSTIMKKCLNSRNVRVIV